MDRAGNGGDGADQAAQDREHDVENQERGIVAMAEPPEEPPQADGAGLQLHLADDGALPEAEAAALAAAEEEKAKRMEMQEWFNKNQFGMLWEATTFVTQVSDLFRSSYPGWTDSKDFISQHLVFALQFYPCYCCLNYLVITRYGSPALLLNRVISTSTLRAMLWFLVFFGCVALQRIDWEKLDATYCETPSAPLLCLPLMVAPLCVTNHLSLYGPSSMVLFPLRVVFTAAREREQLLPPATVLRNFLTRFSLILAADIGLYAYCRRMVMESVGSASPSPVMAEKTLEKLHGILRVLEWIVLAAIFIWMALASITRAAVVALVFVGRRGQRLRGMVHRWLHPHAHIE
jgi:hypothetical protein